MNRAKAQAGESLTSTPPYGYIKDTENPKKWIIDEEAASIVRRIFHLCMEGLGPQKIANVLMEDKVMAPTAYAISRGKKATHGMPVKGPHWWNQKTVAGILERLEYVGHTVNFRTYRKSYKNNKALKNDPEKWMIIENTHEAIIDKETFDIVQRLRQNKRRPVKQDTPPLFSGLLVCADCGSKMYFNRGRSITKKEEFYSCSKYRSNTANCTSHYIRSIVIETLVREELRKVIHFVQEQQDEFVRLMMEVSQQEQQRDVARMTRELEIFRSRILELDILFKRVYEDHVKGLLSDTRFTKMSMEYEVEQHTAMAAAKKMEKELFKLASKKADANHFIRAVNRNCDFSELTPRLLNEMIEKIVIHQSDRSSGKRMQRVDIYFSFGVGMLNLNGEVSIGNPEHTIVGKRYNVD